MPKRKSAAKEEDMLRSPGFAWRVALSIASFFGLIIFIIIWLFFYADSYSLYQNLAVLLVSFLVFIAVMGASWSMWGIRYGQKYGWK